MRLITALAWLSKCLHSGLGWLYDNAMSMQEWIEQSVLPRNEILTALSLLMINRTFSSAMYVAMVAPLRVLSVLCLVSGFVALTCAMLSYLAVAFVICNVLGTACGVLVYGVAATGLHAAVKLYAAVVGVRRSPHLKVCNRRTVLQLIAVVYFAVFCLCLLFENRTHRSGGKAEESKAGRRRQIIAQRKRRSKEFRSNARCKRRLSLALRCVRDVYGCLVAHACHPYVVQTALLLSQWVFFWWSYKLRKVLASHTEAIWCRLLLQAHARYILQQRIQLQCGVTRLRACALYSKQKGLHVRRTEERDKWLMIMEPLY